MLVALADQAGLPFFDYAVGSKKAARRLPPSVPAVPRRSPASRNLPFTEQPLFGECWADTRPDDQKLPSR
jgi:hypothetical protein